MFGRLTAVAVTVVLGLWGAVPASAQQQGGQEFTQSVHGDWTIRCPSDGQSCYMVSLGRDLDGAAIVEMSLVKFPPGKPAAAGATMVVPLGTALQQGVVLQVDSGDRLRFAYDFCAPAGCVANLALTPDLIAAMQAGTRARITVVPASHPDQTKTVGVSLSGFTAAYKALKASGS